MLSSAVERDSEDIKWSQMIIRGGYKTEAALIIICIIIFLTAISASYVMELVYTLIVYLRPPISLNAGQVLQLILYGTLASIAPLAIVIYIFGPKMILFKRELEYVEQGSYLSKVVHSCCKSSKLGFDPPIILDKTPGCSIFVTGQSGKRSKLVMNKEYVAALDKEELEAVILHELAHIKNGDIALMTWAIAFKKALKYWLIFYFLILLVGSRGSIDGMISLILLFGGTPTASGAISLVAPIFYIFVVVAVNSASKVRELAADHYAFNNYKNYPKVLFSSLRSSLLYTILSNVFEGKKRGAVSTLYSRLRKSSRVAITRHPSLRERIERLRRKTFAGVQEKITFPSKAMVILTGIVSAQLLIGINAIIYGTPPGYRTPTLLFDRWDFLGTSKPLLWLIPSGIVFGGLNTIFLWQNNTVDLIKHTTKLHKSIAKLVTKNFLTSAFFYLVVLTFYHVTGQIGDYYLGVSGDVVLYRQMLWLIVDLCATFGAVLFSVLFFIFPFVSLNFLRKTSKN